MSKFLQYALPDGWVQTEKDTDEPLTLCWNDPRAVGYFQVSTAEYGSGLDPLQSDEELIELAIEFGEDNGLGHLASKSSGPCAMGSYGTAVFKPKRKTADAPAYAQVWFLSNGLDFVFATFIAMEPPEEREIAGARRLAEGINFR